MAEWWQRTLGDYKGRTMRCAPGTHETAAELILRHVPREARALDLAAGSGAFLTRLRDHGFADLSAVELNAEGFDVPGIVPQAVDLNSSFADALPHHFGLISAIEIIEHLDCPRNFLRNIRTLLTDGGYLLLSTPNIAHWLGRVRFALSGELRQFQRHNYDTQRHISPITDIQMRLMFEEIGFELIEFKTAANFFGPVKAAIFSPVAAIARLGMGPLANGDVVLYLARKSAAASTSAGRDSFYFKTIGM